MAFRITYDHVNVGDRLHPGRTVKYVSSRPVDSMNGTTERWVTLTFTDGTKERFYGRDTALVMEELPEPDVPRRWSFG